MIKDFPEYDLEKNNCQDFAMSLFLGITEEVNDVDKMVELLLKKRGSPLIFFRKGARKPLITVREFEHQKRRDDDEGTIIYTMLEVKNRRGHLLFEQVLKEVTDWDDLAKGIVAELTGPDSYFRDRDAVPDSSEYNAYYLSKRQTSYNKRHW